MRSRLLLAILASLAVLTLVRNVWAQSGEFDHGRVGISVAIQEVDTAIQLPIWLSEAVVVTPALSVIHISDVATDFGLGLTVRGNVREGAHVPYIGGRVAMLLFSPDEGDSTTDIVLGAVVGGESFLSSSFSVGVEAQLNVVFSDEFSSRFGNPDGTNLNTATLVSATFYF